jgi:metal-responsive CopG/Arc/MetJ family transcriptional regulator
MKIKTSITLSEEILKEVDKLSGRYGNRSILIEQAIREFLAAGAKRRRDLRDIEILNRRTDALNKEAKDVLSYRLIPVVGMILV